jgi:hypothetical protein
MRCLYLTVILAICGACEPNRLTPEELDIYIADEANGLIKFVETGRSRVGVAYRPTDLLVHQNIAGNATVAMIEAERKKYSPYLYFILSLSTDNREALHATEAMKYGDLVQTLSFRMGDYVTLTTDANDTIPVSDFVLNRTYGFSNSTDLLFVFDRKKAEEKEWVQFNLNECGLGIGNQHFRFKMDDIKSIPVVTFNQ